MPDDCPNILLLMTDEQRGDCLGSERKRSGIPVRTPFLDELALNGTRFSAAYSACPVCVPARRTTMTGQRPSSHGLLCNGWAPLLAPTLPQVLHDHGYQTHLVGKLHFKPQRARFGFDAMDWADSPVIAGDSNDYTRFLRENGVGPDAFRAGQHHGCTSNGVPTAPWHLDDRLHFTSWCSTKAVDFLERRDPSCPFFLKVSFVHPHQPLTPPRYLLEKYLRPECPIPEPFVGDWARVFADDEWPNLPVDAWRINLPLEEMRYMRAAYYATVEHIDLQIGRILRNIPKNTVVIFTSDHGEMLGDHQWQRKRNPWEPSARVPMIVQLPEGYDQANGQTCDAPVELMDIMPTLLAAAGADIPETVDGSSMLPLCAGDQSRWRDYVHGECNTMVEFGSGMQYVTDGKQKLTWFPGRGEGQFFDLENDPKEMTNCIDDPVYADAVRLWTGRLIEELEGRPEGFVASGKLQKLNGSTPVVVPGLFE